MLRTLRHRINTLSFLLALLFIYAPISGVRAQSPGGGSEFLSGEVVVKLTNLTALPAVVAQYGLEAKPLDQFGSRPIYRLRIVDGTAVNQKISQLLADTQRRVV